VTGRLPAVVAESAWRGLLALVPAGAPSGAGLAALEMAARALLARVEWGQAPAVADWEAAEVQEGLWLFGEGSMLTVQGTPGRPRQLALAGPDGPLFTVNWAQDGSWVAGQPGRETWAGLPSGAVVSEEELLGRSLEGLDRLEEGADRAEEAALSQGVPRGEVGPARLWGETDEEEAAWTGEMVAPGLSVGSLTSLVAALATRVAARAMRSVPSADPDRAAEPRRAVPPADAERFAGAATCSCGAPRVPGARFCPRCGSPAPVACPRCGVVAVPGARFCKACGAAVAPPTCSRCQAPVSRNLRACPKCGAPTVGPKGTGA